MKILVIILAYNEEDSIQKVIDGVRKTLDTDILVIDDGSYDETRQKALESGVKCISLPLNSGIGVSEQTGFQVAVKEGYDYAIRVDGDGQHDPYNFMPLLQTLLDGGNDLVIGSRFVEDAMYEGGWIRRQGIRFLSWLVSAITGNRVTDVTSGFRGYSRRAMELFADEYPDDFPEAEAITILCHRGLNVKEVAVRSINRESGDSIIRPSVAVYYMSKVTLALLMEKARELMS